MSYGNQSPVLLEIDDLSSSPFQHLLDWDHNRTGQRLISLTTIEQSLRYMTALFGSFLQEDDDSKVSLFCAIWQAVKQKYPTLWVKESKFTTKVNINAVHEFLCDRLKAAWEFGIVDILEPSSVEHVVSEILSRVPVEFWDAEWSNIKIQDNANVRRLIKEDLAQLVENSKLGVNWTIGLNVVGSTD